MNTSTIPTGQQLLLAIADALRLDLGKAASSSTCKNAAADRRVKPATRDELARAVARALNDVDLVRPAASVPRNATDPRYDELDDNVARGLGEFLHAWDQTLTDMRTFNPAGASSYLAVMPFVRLGLEDLAVRWAARSFGRASYFLDGDIEIVTDAIVEGRAFIESVRHALRATSTKRAQLVEDTIPPDTYRDWAEKRVLPQSSSIDSLVSFFTTAGKADAGITLDLRIVVALTELWTWLRRLGVPECARRQMAQGFLIWMKTVVVLLARTNIDEDERAWMIVRGARNPITQERLAALADERVVGRFARDLRVLGGSWTPVVRGNSGSLADLALAAGDERASRRADDPDLELSDDQLLAVTLCIPRDLWMKDGVVDVETDDLTPAMLEAAGTAAIHVGAYPRACTLLRRAATLAPDDVWPRIYLARALHLGGRVHDAEAVARAALAIASESDAHLVLGHILIDLGRFHEAIASLESAARHTKQRPVVYAYHALALARLGEWKGAVEQAELGSALDPRNSACWEILVLAYRALGDAPRARLAAKELAHLGGAVSMSPRSPTAI